MIHANFYNGYLEQIDTATPLSSLLESTLQHLLDTVDGKNDKWWQTPYQKGKWTPLQLVMHLIDVERIYQFRAHSIAAGEQVELPGFDEDAYVESAHANEFAPSKLLEELTQLRKAAQLMFSRFNREKLLRKGIADGKAIDVEALGYILAAHLHHHTQILKNRYL